MKTHLSSAALIIVLFFPITLPGQKTPQIINYQGVVKDSSGTALTGGDYDITFKMADLFVRTALTEKAGYRMLKELCDMGPRVSGSENSIKAIKWGLRKMKDSGFDSVWLQPFIVPHWVPGTIAKAQVKSSNSTREISVAPLGGSVPTHKSGLTACVLEVKDFEQLKQLKDKAEGKIIFFSRPLDQGLLNPIAGYAGAVDQRSNGAIQAAQYGAAAVLIRSITTKYDNNPHTGIMNYTDTLRKIPGAALGYQDADYLSHLLQADPTLKITLNLDCKILPDTDSYNVISEIKGSDYPDEIILVGGHSDSWFLGCGAHDDASGMIQSLEVLELFKKLNIVPKRTIRCVWFINEENGIKGALAYGNYSDSLRINHLAAIESDAGAFTPKGFDIDSDSTTLLKLKSWLPYFNRTGIEYVREREHFM